MQKGMSTFPQLWKVKHKSLRITRGVSDEKLIEPSTLNTFIENASRLWNKAPNAIKASKSISIAKNEIKKYCETSGCETLPI